MKSSNRSRDAKLQPIRSHEPAFREIIALIETARRRAYQAIDTGLIDLYWRVGEYISWRIKSDAWGESTVLALAEFIRQHDASVRGFPSQNLWRMRQFHETWRRSPKLSALLRELSWTSKCQTF